jgi:hypothetical protein
MERFIPEPCMPDFDHEGYPEPLGPVEVLRRSHHADPSAAALGEKLWRRQDLPLMWVSEPSGDGREWIGNARYPDIRFTDDGEAVEDPDPGGGYALYLGGGYYDEAMSYDPVEQAALRRDCFLAAELLYRHAASRGNADAHNCLGYLYAYNRCDGRFWDAVMADDTKRAADEFPADALAVAHFELAADAGCAQACYKLGDMLAQGRGCRERDAAEAFVCFERALQLADRADALTRGSAELRVAGCREQGEGCDQDFSQALVHYERAVGLLEKGVRQCPWYASSLKRARDGAARARQELSGAY